MRKRLITLIDRADEECKHTKDCKICSGYNKGSQCMNYHIADYLLANGVVVMPQTVYWYDMGGNLKEATVKNKFFAELKNGFEYDISYEEIGKTVFHTREDAERALKGDKE